MGGEGRAINQKIQSWNNGSDATQLSEGTQKKQRTGERVSGIYRMSATQQTKNAKNVSNMSGLVQDRRCCHGPRSPCCANSSPYGSSQQPCACSSAKTSQCSEVSQDAERIEECCSNRVGSGVYHSHTILLYACRHACAPHSDNRNLASHSNWCTFLRLPGSQVAWPVS